MSRMRIDDVEIRDADIFELLLDHFPDMVHSIDDDGKILYANRTAETMLGYESGELVGRHIKEIYASRVQSEMENGFLDLKNKGDKAISESWLCTRSGEEFPVEIRSFSIYNDDGTFLRTFSILRDLREIRALRQNLIHAGRLAAIGELASGVAHDISNPLTLIQLSNELQTMELETLKGRTPSETLETISAYSADVLKASESIQKLVEHLRNYSRGVAEEREPVDLHASLEDALFMTRSKVQKTGVSVSCEVSSGQCFVEASPNQLEQVLVNLISNACDAMEDVKTRTLTLCVNPDVLGDEPCWRIDVADSGCGLAEDLSDEIFKSFFTTKEKGKGTGLGLSISRGIVEDHRGTIRAASQAGQGTTFSVLLPRAEPQA